ncbi:hypothetical protein L6270_04675 [Candidatus Parcubacteria bacterium]|nr:hypothetical protein [Patescibacteria group bacterium]MBU4309257.1 hypothetical protein [Patescibacteria group bacterium]MBU4432486.1 hypothetical protein [Patescibacteria group bacterium]MBU4577618.1 hypothetical protein [Patescibacteria group bacterium]MCG2697305.1 hypothetical protein [Candidatus Parcubacteria bacterium]
MAILKYTIGYIDLRSELTELFKRIKCRTEIRYAEKNNVSVQIYYGNAEVGVIDECRVMLKQLLKNEYVPYSKGYDLLLADPENYLLVAYRNNQAVSFVLILPKTANSFFGKEKTAFLGLSATVHSEKKYCPNYLLIWQAIEFLKSQDFIFFNLGLLIYLNARDSALANVAFFKQKWAISQTEITENCSMTKYVYYRYLKRFKFIRVALYLIKKIINK